MSRVLWIAVLLLAPVLGRPPLAAPGLGPQAPTRCYSLEVGRWTLGSNIVDPPQAVPTRVALFESVLDSTGRLPWRRAEASDSGHARGAAIWEPVGQDSLAISFPAGWSNGVVVILPVAGDTVRGTATVYVDYAPFTSPRAVVVARRIPCGTNATSPAPGT